MKYCEIKKPAGIPPGKISVQENKNVWIKSVFKNRLCCKSASLIKRIKDGLHVTTQSEFYSLQPYAGY